MGLWTVNGQENSETQAQATPRWVLILVGIALVFGSVLRLVWLEDMPWHYDQGWLHDRTEFAGRTEPWPMIGIESSLGIMNPGLSVWYIISLGRLAENPVDRLRVIVVINIAAMFGLLLLIWRMIPASRREPWLWMLALFAVNPFTVRFSKRIWQQSVLPPWVLAFFLAHLKRGTRWGSFTWGLVGALIGQIHMSGFFLAFSILVGTIVSEIRARQVSTRWGWWFLGSLIGVPPLVPWLVAVGAGDRAIPVGWTIGNMFFRARMLTYNWFQICSGTGLWYTLQGEMTEFLASPVVGGTPTYAMAFVYVFLLGVTAYALLRLVCRISRFRRNQLPGYSQEPEAWFYLFWGAIGLTFLFFAIVRINWDHYLFISSTFILLAVVILLLPNRKLLAAVVLAQALVSGGFYLYIHEHGGVSGESEYRRTLAWKLEHNEVILPAYR